MTDYTNPDVLPTPTLDEAIEQAKKLARIWNTFEKTEGDPDDFLFACEEHGPAILAALESAKATIEQQYKNAGQLLANLTKANSDLYAAQTTIAKLQASPRFTAREWLERTLPDKGKWFTNIARDYLWFASRNSKSSIGYNVETLVSCIDWSDEEYFIKDYETFKPIPRSTAIDLMCKAMEAGEVKEPAPTRSDFEVWHSKLSEVMGKGGSVDYSVEYANAALRKHREENNVNRT